jgi:hypothetical protein
MAKFAWALKLLLQLQSLWLSLYLLAVYYRNIYDGIKYYFAFFLLYFTQSFSVFLKSSQILCITSLSSCSSLWSGPDSVANVLTYYGLGSLGIECQWTVIAWSLPLPFNRLRVRNATVVVWCAYELLIFKAYHSIVICDVCLDTFSESVFSWFRFQSALFSVYLMYCSKLKSS